MDSMTITFKALPLNEGFARSVVAGFASRLNPTVEQICDIKTAVSEAVTNAIVHGYQGDGEKDIVISCNVVENVLTISVKDSGRGIDDVLEAMKDFYSTIPSEERSGLGFTIMKSFMDGLEVESCVGEGTQVTMRKVIS